MQLASNISNNISPPRHTSSTQNNPNVPDPPSNHPPYTNTNTNTSTHTHTNTDPTSSSRISTSTSNANPTYPTKDFPCTNLHVPFTNQSAYQSTFTPEGWSFQNPFEFNMTTQPSPLPTVQSNSSSHHFAATSDQPWSLIADKKGTTSIYDTFVSPEIDLATGDRFSQLLEAKLSQNQQSNNTTNHTSSPLGTMTSYKTHTVPSQTPGGTRQRQNDTSNSTLRTHAHLWAGDQNQPHLLCQQHEFQVADTINSNNSSMPFGNFDPLAIETALHDFNQVHIPPDLVAPQLPPQFFRWGGQDVFELIGSTGNINVSLPDHSVPIEHISTTTLDPSQTLLPLYGQGSTTISSSAPALSQNGRIGQYMNEYYPCQSPFSQTNTPGSSSISNRIENSPESFNRPRPSSSSHSWTPGTPFQEPSGSSGLNALPPMIKIRVHNNSDQAGPSREPSLTGQGQGQGHARMSSLPLSSMNGNKSTSASITPPQPARTKNHNQNGISHPAAGSWIFEMLHERSQTQTEGKKPMWGSIVPPRSTVILPKQLPPPPGRSTPRTSFTTAIHASRSTPPVGGPPIPDKSPNTSTTRSKRDKDDTAPSAKRRKSLVVSNNEPRSSQDKGKHNGETSITEDNDVGNDNGDDGEKKIIIACHMCRARKLKCDGGRPKCHHCTRRNEDDCVYDTVLRRRGPGKKNGTDRTKNGGANGGRGRGRRRRGNDGGGEKSSQSRDGTDDGERKPRGRRGRRKRQLESSGQGEKVDQHDDHEDDDLGYGGYGGQEFDRETTFGSSNSLLTIGRGDHGDHDPKGDEVEMWSTPMLGMTHSNSRHPRHPQYPHQHSSSHLEHLKHLTYPHSHTDIHPHSSQHESCPRLPKPPHHQPQPLPPQSLQHQPPATGDLKQSPRQHPPSFAAGLMESGMGMGIMLERMGMNRLSGEHGGSGGRVDDGRGGNRSSGSGGGGGGANREQSHGHLVMAGGIGAEGDEGCAGVSAGGAEMGGGSIGCDGEPGLLKSRFE